MDRASIYHSDPEILGGRPVFTGTRVPVDSLVVHLRKGVTLSDFLEDFPSVSREQAEAFLALSETSSAPSTWSGLSGTTP